MQVRIDSQRTVKVDHRLRTFESENNYLSGGRSGDIYNHGTLAGSISRLISGDSSEFQLCSDNRRLIIMSGSTVSYNYFKIGWIHKYT